MVMIMVIDEYCEKFINVIICLKFEECEKEKKIEEKLPKKENISDLYVSKWALKT